MTQVKQSYEIPEDWSFKRDDIASAFDQHVREQLPWYDLATMMVKHFGRHYLPENGVMYDIGASTGNITKSLESIITTRNIEAHSIEVSKEMCDVWSGVGELHNCSCLDFPYKKFDFAVIFLVLMFIPEKFRREYLKTLIANMEDGGAILIFEKVANQGNYLGNAMARLTLAGKVEKGVPAEEIVAKELSLGGVQRPIIHNQFLHLVGVTTTPVFQFGEFRGWVITSFH